MRDWLRQERSDLHDEHILYRLLGVLEGHEQKLDKALAACKRAGATQEYLPIRPAAPMIGRSVVMGDVYVAGEPAEQLNNVHSRVRNIEAMLQRLVEQRHVAGDYTVAEFAKVVGRSGYTVREWCRLERINAHKITGAKRGDEEEWRIPQSEYERYRNEGLLPLPKRR